MQKRRALTDWTDKLELAWENSNWKYHENYRGNPACKSILNFYNENTRTVLLISEFIDNF